MDCKYPLSFGLTFTFLKYYFKEWKVSPVMQSKLSIFLELSSSFNNSFLIFQYDIEDEW